MGPHVCMESVCVVLNTQVLIVTKVCTHVCMECVYVPKNTGFSTDNVYCNVTNFFIISFVYAENDVDVRQGPDIYKF